MSWRSVLLVIFAYSSTRVSCNAAILVTFDRRAGDSTRWIDMWDKVSKNEEFDSLDKRKLCDTITNVKQFTPIQNKRYYERRNKNSKLTPNSSDPNALMDIITSHERHGSLSGGPEGQSCFINSSAGRRRINCWRCVDTMKRERFLSPDPNDQSIYVLEPNVDKDNKSSDFRLTGIYEQAAMVHRDKSLPKDFFTQFETSRDEMESVCELSLDDRLRLCGTISDALMTASAQINYVVERRCISRNINPKVSPPVRILRCSVAVDEWTENFYALLDPRDRGAMFVLLQDDSGQLVPRARLTEVGALLSPVRSRQGEGLDKGATKRKETDAIEGQVSDEEKPGAGAITEKITRRRSLKDTAKKKKLSEYKSGKQWEESADSSAAGERTMKLIIDLNYLPGEAPLEYEEYKAKRSPRKKSGRMSVSELEERLRGVWRSYNPKYRNLMKAKAY